MVIASTKRLILRHFVLDDAPFILKLVNEPTWIQFIGDRNVHTLSDAQKYLTDGALASYQHHGFGLYLVQLRSDGTPIGTCGLVKRDGLSEVDIGFALLPLFTGHGYAFEAATAVLEHARTDLGLMRLVAITAVDNERSMRLLQKLGLQYEKRIIWGEEGEEVLLFGTPSGV